jgi:Na+/H+ antiporter NhaC
MKSKNNHWFIIIAVLIILVIAIAFSSISSDSKSDRDKEKQKREEEEARLLAELEKLERKQEILEKHQFFNEFTKNYLNELCEKRYHQLIKVLIVLLLITNVLIYLLVPKVEFVSLVTWNGFALGGLNLMAIFFFLSVKKGKEYLKGLAMNYIEYRVYENRDKNYYSLKMEMYQNEIEITKKDIEIKKLELNDLSEDTLLMSPDKLIEKK